MLCSDTDLLKYEDHHQQERTLQEEYKHVFAEVSSMFMLHHNLSSCNANNFFLKLIIVQTLVWYLLDYEYMVLVYTTQVNSAFRACWLASSEVISQVLFTSEQPKKNKMTSRFK